MFLRVKCVVDVTMILLRGFFSLAVISSMNSLLSNDIIGVVQGSSTASDITPQSWPSRRRYHMKSDAYPAPRTSEQDVFASRVLHWHVLYCGKNRVCKDHAATNCYRCSPCQCDLNCTMFGDCCPDLVMETTGDDLQRPFTGSDINVLTCESTQFQNLRIKTSESNEINDDNDKSLMVKNKVEGKTALPPVLEGRHESYFMISHCPQHFTGDHSNCDEGNVIAPVTSQESDSVRTFKNVNCARCHDVFDAIPWNIQISCETRTNLSNLYTPRDLIQMSLTHPDCTVVHVPVYPESGRKCYAEPELVNRCNVTGRWTKRDSFLERACQSYLTPKLLDHVLYKNVFCYMCNHGDEPEAQILLTSCQKKPATWNPSMQVTLGYLDLNKDDVNERRPLGDIPYQLCAKRGLYDSLEESCREVTCEDGQQLVAGMCKPMFLTARGLGYELYFGLRPVVPIDVSGDHDILHRLPAEMEIYLGQTLLKGKVKLQDFAMSFNTTNQDGWCSQLSNDLGVYARIISNTWNDQEQLQTELLSLRHTRFNIDSQNWNMSFQSFPSETAWHTMQPSRRHTPLALSSCVVIVANSHMEHRKDGTMRVGTTTSDPLMANENNLIPSYIRLSSLLTCPHVQLLPHEYSVAEPADDLMLSWGVVLHSNSYLMNLQGNVTICMSDFLHKLDKYSSKRSPTEETLAIVLLSISVLSLFVSFLVFLLFTVLRSLPGKNNMILVVCLFLSQMSMLIGYLSSDAIKMCVIMGVSLHYFTLCVFCSFIVCSFHVYSTFTTMHLSRDASRDRKSFVLYCCFIFLVPLTIVGIIIGVYVSRQVTWRSFGYGIGSFCLLSSTISLWLALFLPLVVSMVVVVVLFCLTSNSIQHSKEVETNRSDEKHVHFYLRASLITSVTWILGIAGMAASVVPLMITFIIMQCLLGVYVFVSLVLTPRVTGLLSGSCCQSRRPPRGRTSLNMKMASSNDCPVKPPCILGTGYRKRDPNVSGHDSKRHPLERYTKRSDYMETIA